VFASTVDACCCCSKRSVDIYGDPLLGIRMIMGAYKLCAFSILDSSISLSNRLDVCLNAKLRFDAFSNFLTFVPMQGHRRSRYLKVLEIAQSCNFPPLPTTRPIYGNSNATSHVNSTGEIHAFLSAAMTFPQITRYIANCVQPVAKNVGACCDSTVKKDRGDFSCSQSAG